MQVGNTMTKRNPLGGWAESKQWIANFIQHDNIPKIQNVRGQNSGSEPARTFPQLSTR